MDPICEEKINYLQKYVPFLANLIELLANDRENEGKLEQMQLLFDLLKKPDNSVNINTLEKCEEVLSRVFGNADGKQNEDKEEKTDTNAENEIIKSEQAADNADIAALILIPEESVEEPSPHLNGCSKEQVSEDCAPEDITLEEDTTKDSGLLNEEKQGEDEAKPEENDKIKSEKNDDANMSCETPLINETFNGNQTDKGIGDPADESQLDTELETDLPNPPTENSIEPEGPEIRLSTDTKKVSEIEENDDVSIPRDKNDNNDHEESSSILENNDFPSTTCSSERKPVEPSDHLQSDDVICQNAKDILPFKIISAESLAIQSVHSLADDTFTTEPENRTQNTAKDQNTDESDRNVDPLALLTPSAENLLSVIPNSVPIENNTSLHHTSRVVDRINEDNDDDDDDDDVLLIETRTSPICIDSDPDDGEGHTRHNISLPILKPTNSPSLIPPAKTARASARKSTSAVMQSTQAASRKFLNKKQKSSHSRGFLLKKDPKILMETISLLDSDSDDEKAIRKPIKTGKAKPDDDVIIVSSKDPQRMGNTLKKPCLMPQPKQMPRLPSKTSTNRALPRVPTAQSNFLNAVNLQPTPKSSTTPKPSTAVKSGAAPKPSTTTKLGTNPVSQSSQLSMKKFSITNALYSDALHNRKLPASAAISQDESSSNDSMSRNLHSKSTTSVHQVQDRMLKEWLETFLTNFASSQQLASHACFVLLQRVLKYRFFQRLKEIRLILNTLAKNLSSETVDIQPLLDLRNVFLKDGYLTEPGRKFCRFATNDAFGKPVALTTDSRTGKVTCRTRIGPKTENHTTDIVKPAKLTVPVKPPQQAPPNNTFISPSNATITSASPASATPPIPSSSSSFNSIKRSRKGRKQSDGTIAGDGDNNDNDYTPYMGELVLEEEVVSERKKSLRTNRTRRKEAGFTYSEDHDDEEFEALAKKIEDKKREELRLAEEREEREREREIEHEKKVKKTVAKKTTAKRSIENQIPNLELPREPTRKRLRLDQTEIIGNTTDDLLTPTWIEADDDELPDDDDDDDSLQDFAEEPHMPDTSAAENGHLPVNSANNPVIETVEDPDDPYYNAEAFDIGSNRLLKNIDRRLHTQSLHFDFCVHCLRRVPRTVHHYVNEHRLSEVFTSRLRTKDIRRLLTTNNVGFVHLYKGNQQQYAAHCIFCDKDVKFLLPYWFEHFTMHTGEYGFKCSGCNIRKPTRSLLTNHLQSGIGCPKKGAAVRLYTFDTKSNQIEAHICTMCNFTQLHHKNIVRHVRTQHGIEDITAKHVIKVTLLQISGPPRDQNSITNDASQLSLLQSDDDDASDATEDEKIESNGEASAVSVDNSSLMMQNDFACNDDLSFTICGMLDVQTNLSTPEKLPPKSDASNHVDN